MFPSSFRPGSCALHRLLELSSPSRIVPVWKQCPTYQSCRTLPETRTGVAECCRGSVFSASAPFFGYVAIQLVDKHACKEDMCSNSALLPGSAVIFHVFFSAFRRPLLSRLARKTAYKGVHCTNIQFLPSTRNVVQTHCILQQPCSSSTMLPCRTRIYIHFIYIEYIFKCMCT